VPPDGQVCAPSVIKNCCTLAAHTFMSTARRSTIVI
jgi:hypothetical protein